MVRRTLERLALLVPALILSVIVSDIAQANDYTRPWRNANTSIVLDAYEYTPLDWSKMRNNTRLAGFINKASDGLSPKARCRGDRLCRVTWRRYSAAKELYHTRRQLAKELGLKWGAYHLGRPGNPIQQADHFMRFARPDKDDLIALDIEHNDPVKWMSLKDAEIFAKVIKRRTGRYPVLYTNHSTAKYIAANRDDLPLLSRLNLWYARYKPSIPGVFPMGNWDNYTIWQFSSMVNCSDRSCPWRINGAGNWIDVNVVNMPPEELRRKWPFAELIAGTHSKNVISQTDTVKVGSVFASAYRPSSKGISKAASAIAAMVAGSKTKPSWRPGAKIVKRKTVLFSTDIVNAFHRTRQIPPPPKPKIIVSMDQVLNVHFSSKAAQYTKADDKLDARTEGLFPAESVLFKPKEFGPLRERTNKI